MRRSFKFVLRPTVKQAVMLTMMVEDHRQLYNAALEERRTAYTKRGVSIRYGEQSAQLKEIRADDVDGQGRWSFTSQQQTLRRLEKSFAAFFRRVRSGQKPGYPRFKGKGWFDTVTFVEGDGARWDSQPCHPSATFVRLHGIGHLRVHQHRPVTGRVKRIEVKREGSRWYVIVSCDDVPAAHLPVTGREVGLDVGVAHFATLSQPINGVTDACGHIANPRHRKAAREQLAAAQQAYARTRRGSKRRRKTAQKIGRLHRKVARQRTDHAHKAALALVRTCDVIVVEDLKIVNMVRRAAPRPNGDGTFAPNGGSAKTGLNDSITDAGWGVFLTILAYKAESAGRDVILVNPANTSRTCPKCGYVARENRKTQAEFVCVRCRYSANADVVGASNIKRAGLVLRDARAA
ncbi:RNA-guided endonuclease InsQ/TnpB family protein [Nonomuraea angiospora]|uniref:RNA-guided endonuclease InsQ/TnpB family protein n=1 Tax=Nonomuraea angiospora TaxID=46172 RepID=UPI0029BAE6A3|nr:transposase [Nonomuraea angiospora]MDX3105579.1 transposase [Nonomuraea angiospora]